MKRKYGGYYMQVYDAKKLQHNFFSPHHSPEKHFLTNLSKAMIIQSGWLKVFIFSSWKGEEFP